MHGTAIHCPTLHGGIVSCYAIVCKVGGDLTLTLIVIFYPANRRLSIKFLCRRRQNFKRPPFLRKGGLGVSQAYGTRITNLIDQFASVPQIYFVLCLPDPIRGMFASIIHVAICSRFEHHHKLMILIQCDTFIHGQTLNNLSVDAIIIQSKTGNC